MKILCEHSPGGSHFVRSGWKAVFELAGHTFRWLPEGAGVFDAFDSFEPDMFLGTTYNLSRAHAKCIANRPDLKVGLFASAWGPLIDKLDLELYPIVVASEQEKLAIRLLKESTGKPDFVFIHVTDKFLEPTMGHWSKVNVEAIGILNGFDAIAFAGATSRPELRCDASCVGGIWPYKARNLDRYVLPLCHPDLGLDVKIFGNTRWPTHRYLGPCSVEDNRDLTVSSTVNMNVSEPHSTDLGFDLIERFLRVPGTGGFAVCDYIEEANEVFTNGEIVMAKTPKEFHDAVIHFVAHSEDRLPFIKAGQRKVLDGHTYFDRVEKFFQAFGLVQEAIRCQEIKKSWILENFP